MRAVLFATTSRESAADLLRALCVEHAAATWIVFCRDEDRAALAASFPEVEFRRDKPAGGRLAFVRALRRERLDLAVVVWDGGERFQPLRLAALAVGARRTLAVDRRGRRHRVAWHAPWTWGPHAARALLATRPATIGRLLAACYRGTLGLLVAGLLLAWFRARRGPPLPRPR